jgi:hypothetical protein
MINRLVATAVVLLHLVRQGRSEQSLLALVEMDRRAVLDAAAVGAIELE